MKERPIATRCNQELGVQSMYHTFNRQAAPRGTATHCTQTRDCCSLMAHGAFIFLSLRPRTFLSPSPSPLRRALGMRVADAGHGACAERRKVAAGRERVRYRSASAKHRRRGATSRKRVSACVRRRGVRAAAGRLRRRASTPSTSV